MIAKKWRKLEKQLIEENEKNKNDDNIKEDINDKKEIIIVDMNNNNEEKDNEDNNNKNRSKYKSKPNPILKIDTNSLNLTDYQINGNENNNNYLQNNNYCRLFQSILKSKSRNYINDNHKYNCFSNFNTQNYNNNHIKTLAKSNDYTYVISSKNPLLSNKINNNNTPYRLNRNFTTYLEQKINDNNYNNCNKSINDKSLIYKYISKEKPYDLRSMSYRSYTDINYNGKNDDDYIHNNNNKKNNYLYSEMDFYPKEKRITYSLNKDNIRDIIMKYKNKNININVNKDYNDSIPFKLNYKYQ